MVKILSLLFLWVGEKILSFAFKKLLYGAGLGLVAYGVSQGLFNMLLNYIQSNFGILGSLFFLIDLSGTDIALSLVISAIATRLMFNAGRFSFRKL